MVFTNILLGLLLIGVGFLMVKFNFQLTRMFSGNNWFERHLGSGSTYFVMQVLAIFVIIYGTMTMLGLSDNFWGWLLSPISKLFRR